MADTGLGTSVTFAGRVLHYTCNDMVTTDSSGNNNTGIVTGSGTSLSTGLINNKLTFNGSGYIKFTSTALLGLVSPSSEISVSCWAKTTQTDGPILSLRHSTNASAILDFVIGYNGVDNSGTGKLSVLIHDDSSSIATRTYISGGAAINDGNWHHVAVTRNSVKALTLYVDGSYVNYTTDGVTGTITPNVAGSAIGFESYIGSYLVGSLDDFQIYNRALTAGEITSIYNGGLTVSYSLSAAPAAFAFTRIAANTLYGRNTPLQTTVGTFTTTGIAAGTLYSLDLPAEIGAFNFTGPVTAMLLGETLTAAPVAFTLTGIAAGSAATYILAATPASFALTGVPIGLNKTGSYSLVANTGAFTLTGIAAGSVATYVMPMAPSALALSGSPINLISGYRIVTAPSVFTSTGIAAGWASTYVIQPVPAVFALTGIPVGLNKTGALRLTADTGVVALNGTRANLIYASRIALVADCGEFDLWGRTVILSVDRGTTPIIPPDMLPPPGVLNMGRKVWIRPGRWC